MCSLTRRTPDTIPAGSSHVLHRLKFLKVNFGHSASAQLHAVVKPTVSKSMYKRMESLSSQGALDWLQLTQLVETWAATPADNSQVSSAKLLGVYFTDQLSMTEHLNKTVAVCNQRLYLLCQLKKQGMSVSCLHIVFDSIVICKILYASPAWFGYVNNDHVNLIHKLLSKAFRWGLSGKRYDAWDLLSDRDLHLFETACRPYHCLYHLLPATWEARWIWFERQRA